MPTYSGGGSNKFEANGKDNIHIPKQEGVVLCYCMYLFNVKCNGLNLLNNNFSFEKTSFILMTLTSSECWSKKKKMTKISHMTITEIICLIITEELIPLRDTSFRNCYLNKIRLLYVDYLHELSLKTLLSYKVCKVVIIMKKFP